MPDLQDEGARRLADLSDLLRNLKAMHGLPALEFQQPLLERIIGHLERPVALQDQQRSLDALWKESQERDVELKRIRDEMEAFKDTVAKWKASQPTLYADGEVPGQPGFYWFRKYSTWRWKMREVEHLPTHRELLMDGWTLKFWLGETKNRCRWFGPCQPPPPDSPDSPKETACD